MVLRLLAPLLASAWLGRCAVLRGNEAEPQKVQYDVHLGPGKLRCNGTAALFAGPVDSREECEVKCDADSACLFYHVFPGTRRWCKTSSSCEGFAKDNVDGIIVYAKRGKVQLNKLLSQASDAVESSDEKATVESAAHVEEDLEDPVADALVKSSVQNKAAVKPTHDHTAASKERSGSTSARWSLLWKGNMTEKAKLKAEKKAKKKEMDAEKKKLKAAKAEKKKLEAESKAKRKAEEEKEKAKKKALKEKAKADKKKEATKSEGKGDEKKKAWKTLMMLQEQVSTGYPTMAPIIVPSPRPTHRPSPSPTSTPRPTHEHVEVFDEANPWTTAPTPVPTATPPTMAPTGFTEEPTMAPPTPKPTAGPTKSPTIIDHGVTEGIPWAPDDTPTVEPTPAPPPTEAPSPPVKEMKIHGCFPHNGTNMRILNNTLRIGNNLETSLDAFKVGHGIYWLLNIPWEHAATLKVVGEHEFGMPDPLSHPDKVPGDDPPSERYFGCHVIIRNGTTPDAPGSMDHRYGNFTFEIWGHCHEGQTFDVLCHGEVHHTVGRFRYSAICDKDHEMNAVDMSNGGVDEVLQEIQGATAHELQVAADMGVDGLPVYERKKRQTPKNLHLWACPEPSTTSGRCGPYYGRCNSEMDGWAKYCNEKTYWCGNTEDMRTRQTSDYWDATPKEDCIIAPEASFSDAALYTNSQFPDRKYRKPIRHLFGHLPEYEEEDENATKTSNSTSSTLRTRRR